MTAFSKQQQESDPAAQGQPIKPTPLVTTIDTRLSAVEMRQANAMARTIAVANAASTIATANPSS